MKLSQFVDVIKNHPEFGEAFTYHRYLPAIEAVHGPDVRLPAEITESLHRLGIRKLYQHQVEAIKYIREGENVVVATPTASGKSLIYNLGVLEALLQDEKAKALYVFPLKALEAGSASP